MCIVRVVKDLLFLLLFLSLFFHLLLLLLLLITARLGGQEVLDQLTHNLDINTISQHPITLLQRSRLRERELALDDREAHQTSDFILGKVA